jgi:hypothetical protein
MRGWPLPSARHRRHVEPSATLTTRGAAAALPPTPTARHIAAHRPVASAEGQARGWP